MIIMISPSETKKVLELIEQYDIFATGFANAARSRSGAAPVFATIPALTLCPLEILCMLPLHLIPLVL